LVAIDYMLDRVDQPTGELCERRSLPLAERNHPRAGTSQNEESLMNAPNVTQNLYDIFDDPDWKPVPEETCRRLKINPHKLRLNEKTKSLALILKQSTSGRDHALKKEGLHYIKTTRQLRDGTTIEQAFVVYTEPDQQTPEGLKVLHFETPERTEEHVADLPLQPSKYGGEGYWWIKLSGDDVRF
jgi:hypothetical protein